MENWWPYFLSDQARSEEVLAAAPVTDRERLALHGYFYAYMPVLFGVVVLSAGLGYAMGHIAERLPLKDAALLGGGAMFYLLGITAFRRIFCIRPTVIRLVAVVAVVAACPTILAGTAVSAFAQIGLLFVITVGFILLESASGRTVRKHVGRQRPNVSIVPAI